MTGVSCRHTDHSSARGYEHLEHRVLRRELRLDGEVEVRAACEATSPVPPGDPAAARARGQVADLLDPALLDLEEIGEVGVDEELERAEGGLEAVVAHRDVFAHPTPDVPVAEHHEVRVGEAGLRLVAQHERRAERVDGGCRERFRPPAVHAQAQLGEEPRVAEEETVREAGQHVARRE